MKFLFIIILLSSLYSFYNTYKLNSLLSQKDSKDNLKNILISGEQHGFGFLYALFHEKDLNLSNKDKREFDSYKIKIILCVIVSIIALIFILQYL